MKNQRNAGVGIVAAVLACVFCMTAFAAEQQLPQETHDGLMLVPDRKVAIAYVNPDAEFSGYNKIMILDCYVAFKKDWQKDHTQTGSRLHVSTRDMEEIKAAVAELFREVFTEKLGADGDYEIVDAASEDVLLVRPAIIDLDISAPDSMSTGRTRTYTAESGAATIVIELYDSVTGAILARAADREITRSAGGYLSYSNRATNRADARRALGHWAELLKEWLDEVHGK
jgi:hypothetical protein